MRKRLVLLGVLLFIVAVSISYMLSNVVSILDSNTLRAIEENKASNQKDASTYIAAILFLVFIYLIYHIFFVELKPWFKMKKIKKREDPIEFMEYLSEEIRKNKKNKKKQNELIGRLNTFYEYSERREKEKAMKIGAIRKYLKK